MNKHLSHKLISPILVLSIVFTMTLCVCLSLPALAADKEFTIQNGVLTGYNGDGGAVVIPDGVTKIGNDAFRKNNITSVTFPNSLTAIGARAFRGCRIKSLNIPDSVVEIGDYAFENCDFLSSLTLPDSRVTIGESAFFDCYSLTKVVIPEGTESIGEEAFAGCKNLNSVTLSHSISNIGEKAFAGTPWISELGEFVVFGNDLTQYNGKGGNVIIPHGVVSIGKMAFEECGSPINVYLPKSMTAISELAFAYSKLTAVSIPNSVTSIDELAFACCCELTKMVIPNSVKTLGDGAFYYCTSLKSVHIPAGVTSIGYEAFGECSALTDIYYGGSEVQWKAIAIHRSNNEVLAKVKVHYNCSYDSTANGTVSNINVAVNDMSFEVNGTKKNISFYNINGNNYFKLRDIAALCVGTDKKFAVDYNNGVITLTTGGNYIGKADDLQPASSGSAVGVKSTMTVIVDGKPAALAAYNIKGYTYYQLRALCRVLDINVTWNETTRTSGIDTTKGYSGDVRPLTQIKSDKFTYPPGASLEGLQKFYLDYGYYVFDGRILDQQGRGSGSLATSVVSKHQELAVYYTGKQYSGDGSGSDTSGWN